MSAPFVNIPRGFFAANDVLNRLPADYVKSLTVDACKAYFSKTEEVSKSQAFKTLRAQHPEDTTDEAQLGSAINALAFCFSQAKQYDLSAEEFNTSLKAKTDFAKAVRICLATALNERDQVAAKEAKEDTEEPATKTLQLARVVDMQWKLGVGVSSSNCEALHTPFVTLVLTLADSRGRRQSHTLEMNLTQFKQFKKSFQDLSTALDSA